MMCGILLLRVLHSGILAYVVPASLARLFSHLVFRPDNCKLKLKVELDIVH
jgi:hypothetical protein